MEKKTWFLDEVRSGKFAWKEYRLTRCPKVSVTDELMRDLSAIMGTTLEKEFRSLTDTLLEHFGQGQGPLTDEEYNDILKLVGMKKE